ncbi:hypothetical protein PENSUB_7761 [Penicillium subrubescens]|uniref:Uncharacterized protein n=1 Tax=Penicillium subrubescens TaxID=1316194 RepID=A0A1Q5TK73_9EURO|nr:hypothetical protein PENSUB_7761 [Penicillium subrubescens]
MAVKKPLGTLSSEERFLNDICNASKVLGVSYSEKQTRSVLSNFSKGFHRGCVLWGTTDQSTGNLSYRIYERHSIDVLLLPQMPV